MLPCQHSSFLPIITLKSDHISVSWKEWLNSTKLEVKVLNIFHSHQVGAEDNWSPGPAWHTSTCCSAASIVSATNPQESYSFCSVIKEGQKTHPNASQQVILKFIQIYELFWFKLGDYSAAFKLLLRHMSLSTTSLYFNI